MQSYEIIAVTVVRVLTLMKRVRAQMRSLVLSYATRIVDHHVDFIKHSYLIAVGRPASLLYLFCFCVKGESVLADVEDAKRFGTGTRMSDFRTQIESSDAYPVYSAEHPVSLPIFYATSGLAQRLISVMLSINVRVPYVHSCVSIEEASRM